MDLRFVSMVARATSVFPQPVSCVKSEYQSAICVQVVGALNVYFQSFPAVFIVDFPINFSDNCMATGETFT
jgi:hypothetical protein